MWATPEVLNKLFAHFGIAVDAAGATRPEEPKGVGLQGDAVTYDDISLVALWDRLDIDGILTVSPPYVGPPLAQAGEVSLDEWGMGLHRQHYGTGSYGEQVIYPLAGPRPSPTWRPIPGPRRTGTITRRCRGWPQRFPAGPFSAATPPISTITTSCAGWNSR